MAQAYYSAMTVGGAQVPSTQTDFPKLSFPTDSRFKTIGNGGHVANSNGYDIRPYSDSGLTTPLTYELVYYNASTGQFEMHVKIPSLSNGYVTYFGYGDAGLNTDGSSNTTWSSNFQAVYHLADGTTLNLNDSTSSGALLANNNIVTATSGQIDGAALFVSTSSQFLRNNVALTSGSAFTFSAWINATSFPNAYNAIIGWGPTTTHCLFVKSNGTLACYLQATGQVNYDGTGSHTLSSATPYLLHMTYDSTSGLIGYVNGASDHTAAANGSATAHSDLRIGSDPVTTGRFWDGKIDEARIVSVARSADWVSTEYNNQFAPGTFETLGTEVSVNPMMGIYTI